MTKTSNEGPARRDARTAGGRIGGDGAPPAEPQIVSDDFIGRALKAHFDDIVGAPVPDKFLVLLAELEAKEQGHGG